jgi:hypothetical protein
MEPLLLTGFYSFFLIGMIIFTILILVGRSSHCDGLKDTGTIKIKECCKGTWESFGSSVPLTIFIFTIVAIITLVIAIYIDKFFK